MSGDCKVEVVCSSIVGIYSGMSCILLLNMTVSDNTAHMLLLGVQLFVLVRFAKPTLYICFLLSFSVLCW
jgi:hypothetical protein